MSRISINREVTSLFITQLIHTQLQCIAEEEKDTRARKKEVTAVGRSSYYFGFHFSVDSIFEEVVGFSTFMVSPRKNIVFIVYCV